MTLKDKLLLDHPINPRIDEDGDPMYCPYVYKYAEKPEWCCDPYYGDANKRCRDCWDREFHEDKNDKPQILDSGARREFGTGAVRDIQEGKGRCDLLPLDVVSDYIPYNTHNCAMLLMIDNFQKTGEVAHLYRLLEDFGELHFKNRYTMSLEVSIHFEEGAKKYGENNWQKGIPVHCYIDSAVRHYLKFLRGDKDEPHDRAFCWNIMCAIWTCKHKPELNDYAKRDTSEVEEALG